MKLILQKDVKNLGKTGDQVTVKGGYARNYLLPNQLALALNKTRIKDWNHKKTLIEVKKKQAIVERQSVLKKISAVELSFEKESRTEGRLFGSVTAAEISNALEKKHKLLVDKKDILTEPLKEVGEHLVMVALDPENKIELKVIIKQKITKKDEAVEKPKKGFFAKRFFSKEEEDSDDIENPSLKAVAKKETNSKEPPPKQDSKETAKTEE